MNLIGRIGNLEEFLIQKMCFEFEKAAELVQHKYKKRLKVKIPQMERKKRELSVQWYI